MQPYQLSILERQLWDAIDSRDMVAAKNANDQIRKIAGNSDEASLDNAWYLATLGNYDEAMNSLGNSGYNMNITLCKAFLNLCMHRIDVAKTQFPDLQQLQSAYGNQTYPYIWSIAFMDGRFDDADRILNAAVSSGIDESTIFDMQFSEALKIKYDFDEANSVLGSFVLSARSRPPRGDSSMPDRMILMSQAEIASAKGDEDTATDKYREVLTKTPTFFDARTEMMYMQWQFGDYDFAQTNDIGEMVVLGGSDILKNLGVKIPADVVASEGQPLVSGGVSYGLYALGELKLAVGDVKLATACADKSLDLNPYNEEAYALKSDIAQVNNDVDTELDAIAKGCQLAPESDNPAIRFLILNHRYSPQKRYQGLDPIEMENTLFKKYTEGHKRYPASPDYSYSLALLTSLKDMPAAIDLMRSTYTTCPKVLANDIELAIFEASRGNIDDAETVINGMTIPFDVTYIIEQYDVAPDKISADARFRRLVL